MVNNYIRVSGCDGGGVVVAVVEWKRIQLILNVAVVVVAAVPVTSPPPIMILEVQRDKRYKAEQGNRVLKAQMNYPNYGMKLRREKVKRMLCFHRSTRIQTQKF